MVHLSHTHRHTQTQQRGYYNGTPYNTQSQKGRLFLTSDNPQSHIDKGGATTSRTTDSHTEQHGRYNDRPDRHTHTEQRGQYNSVLDGEPHGVAAVVLIKAVADNNRLCQPAVPRQRQLPTLNTWVGCLSNRIQHIVRNTEPACMFENLLIQTINDNAVFKVCLVTSFLIANRQKRSLKQSRQ